MMLKGGEKLAKIDGRWCQKIGKSSKKGGTKLIEGNKNLWKLVKGGKSW